MGNKDIGGKKKESKKKSKDEEKAKPAATATTTTESAPEPAITAKSSDSHASKVLRCECKHTFQDMKYGSGMRVHTPKKAGGWRCTVCSKER